MVTIWDWTAAAVRDTSLSAGAFRTGVALSTFADSKSGEGAHPGQTKLAEMLGITDRAVRKNLDALESAGWIIKVSRGGRAGLENRASVYSLRIPTGTEVPGTQVPIGTQVPPGTEVPIGTFRLPNRNFQASQPEPTVPTILSLTSPKASSPKGTRKRAPLMPLPADFAITENLRTWARTKTPGLDLELETERFKNHAEANARTAASWAAAWRNWMLKALEYSAAKATSQPAGEWHHHDDSFDETFDPYEGTEYARS